MSPEGGLEARIEEAARAVGAVWPLHSFVTGNPLAGLAEEPFEDAVANARSLLGSRGYPSPAVFRRAWEAGRIDADVLGRELRASGYERDPEVSLERMADSAGARENDPARGPMARVDALLSKWLAAFLDEGQADWTMPNRERGFYGAVRTVAPYDGDVPQGVDFADLPEEPSAVVRDALAAHPEHQWTEILAVQLAALPGWTGFIKRRRDDDGPWQSAAPIDLTEYLAVRLALLEGVDAGLAPVETHGAGPETAPSTGRRPRRAVWLAAWEQTYRSELVRALADASERRQPAEETGRPDAQLVFCIDTRSEIIRRHVEAAGDYETLGYAGFFGVPMRYAGYGSEVTVDARPPILESEHRIPERPSGGTEDKRAAHDGWRATVRRGRAAIERLRSNAATAFSFVESAGVAYGAALLARTLLPARVRDLLELAEGQVPDTPAFCEPGIDYDPDAVHDLRSGLTLEEKVQYAAAAVEVMGVDTFARVVVVAGHASETTNNPFAASLDCGACAGNPGGPSARVLAAICNDDAVRAKLRERGIEIPEDTVFVPGEHNTTTDEISLHTTGVPESHAADLATLAEDLATARAGAAAERARDMGARPESPTRETERRAADWAETRPEWGLAGNAGFVIGPRELTAELDLDGRAFLHSYDWDTDPDGTALQAIVSGPLLVGQWINAHYYFATVDADTFASGSKVTHNPVGNVGVYQGNGGDLMAGLPVQSLMDANGDPYHQPLRLSAVIHAPRDRVSEVLTAVEEIRRLLDNGWLSLTVVDPERGHRAFEYDGELSWQPRESDTTTPPAAGEPAVADD